MILLFRENNASRFWPKAIGSLGSVKSAHNAQCKIRDQVEKQYAQLKKRNPRIMDGVEPVFRDIEPSAVVPIRPVMRQKKERKPP